MSVKSQPPQSEPAEELLMCEVLPERGRVRICPSGALDVATAPMLEDRLWSSGRPASGPWSSTCVECDSWTARGCG